MRDWQLSLSGVQECSELRRKIIYNFFFVSYLMNEVKSIWWTCMAIFRRYESPRGEEFWLDIMHEKVRILKKNIYMDFFLQLNYSLWSKLSYLNSKARILGKYWLPMTICWTWLDLENYNFIGIIFWWMILIS